MDEIVRICWSVGGKLLRKSKSKLEEDTVSHHNNDELTKVIRNAKEAAEFMMQLDALTAHAHQRR